MRRWRKRRASRARVRVFNPNRVKWSPQSPVAESSWSPTWRVASAVRSVLTAAGYKVKQKDADLQRRLLQPWQAKAFSYYDILGEIKYSAQFYARGLAPLRLYVGKIDQGGDIIEVENEPEVTDHLERIQDPGGGRSGLLSAYGRLQFLVGECYLFVSRNPDTEDEQWEMLSTDELRVTGGGYTRFRAPSLMAEMYREPDDDEFEPIDDDTAVAYRLWRRHPRYSMLADSTMQGVLELCEELVLLTQAVRARARSRLAGPGILAIPEEIGPPPVEPTGDEDPNEDPLLRDITDAMMAPIADEGAASAVVPIVIRGKSDLLEKIRHIQVIDPTQFYPESGLRRECIERIAMGLDLPPEILLGMTDANHWTAWQIDEQTWKSHLQPVAQQLVDDLTAAYFRPALREAGHANYADYVITYDATAIINHPDRTKDAKDLYDRRAIGKSTLREAAGFDDDDAPTDEELYEMLGVAIRDGSLALFGIPSVRTGIEPAAGVLESTSGGVTSSEPGDQSTEVAKGPPDEPTGPNTPGESLDVAPVVGALGNGHRRDIMASRILGACDLALHRARELAGARLVSYAKRDPEAKELVVGVETRKVAVVLGRDRVRALGVKNEFQLVDGAGDLIVDAIRLYGIPGELADKLAELIEQHAARTLYDERPPPVPAPLANYIHGLTAELE